jgi:hypothetical protein
VIDASRHQRAIVSVSARLRQVESRPALQGGRDAFTPHELLTLLSKSVDFRVSAGGFSALRLFRSVSVTS